MPNTRIDRRSLLRSAGAAAAAVCTTSLLPRDLARAAAQPDAAQPVATPTRVVDTHTHFYDPTRPQGVPWPPRDTPLYRKVMPADWQALAEPLGIDSTIVVEASPWVEDNQWVLDLAAEDRSIVGLVGNLDPRQEGFSEHLNRFAKNPIFRGIRWRSDLVPIDRDADLLIAAAKQLADLDLELDLNGPADALPSVSKLADAVPALRIVVNHLGASGDPSSLNPQWLDQITAVARRPNVFMKVSALVEQVRCEPGEAPREVAYYLPILDPLWDRFGEDRLIFGSNWPVSDRGAPYDVVFGIVRDYFVGKGDQAAEKYFWRNSQAAYRWQERTA
ncbi:MAG: amidohydrolase [Planctomycetaceae bacterium]|nr:MAG: amidohydrolase [Planctomycetaceae bacterium]